jgi:hypothetical protein
MTTLENSYQSYAPFWYFEFANFLFPDDNLWTKSQIEARCGI